MPQSLDVRACLGLIDIERNNEKTADFAVTDDRT